MNNYSLIKLIGIDLVKVPSTQDSSVDFLSKVEIDRVLIVYLSIIFIILFYFIAVLWYIKLAQ
jgi:hypothetical protein